MKFTKAILFPLRAKFGSALVLALVACCVTFAQDVRTNYMLGTDFAKFHTYAWIDEVQGVPAVGGHPDQILDAQVKQAIDSQMLAKDFTKVVVGAKADLLVGYQLAVNREKQINGMANGMGGWGGWGPWGGLDTFSATTSINYIGTFVVGMYDPAVKKLVWIGAAQHAIEPSKKTGEEPGAAQSGAAQ